ncbi:mannitol dehydrogenase family protein [Eoetvoesiella caeni]
MTQLSNATLGLVPAGIAKPSYDRSAVPTRIVHMGAGSFHRSHQAVYTDEAMQQGDPNWGILAVSVHNPAINHALVPQDGLYTSIVDDNGNRSARIIGSLTRLACLADARHEVIDALCSEQTEIVTLTITERGYGYSALHDGLDDSLPHIQLDLNAPQSARSPIGVLAWAIYQRKLHGLPPFTLLSCDHLPANGKILQRVLEHYIERVQDDLNDPGLLQYFLDQYACPCSLVDRAVLACTAADIAATESLLGLHDAAPVVAEPFSQWIIQDWFSAGRPKWENTGAMLVPHVAPFEKAQEVMLDAGRFALAHLAAVAGYKTLAQAMAEPEIARYMAGLLNDAIVTLPKHQGYDWDAYKQELLGRFANSALQASTAQSTIDGTTVLASGIVAPAQLRLARGLSIEHHATAIAAWMRFLTGRSERQEELLLSDPLQAELARAMEAAGGRDASAFDLAEALLNIPAIFGTELPNDLEFARRVTAALQDLMSLRVLGTVTVLNNPELRTAPTDP